MSDFYKDVLRYKHKNLKKGDLFKVVNPNPTHKEIGLKNQFFKFVNRLGGLVEGKQIIKPYWNYVFWDKEISAKEVNNRK